MRLDAVHLGDCRELLRRVEPNSVDLVFTSPPYADNRKGTYYGVPIQDYVDWFLPISAELLRVLKPTGSFVLNIKERAFNGERQTYVLELLLGMKKQGWLWTEEYIWCKSNCYPGKWPNRFRDSWERLLHFSKTRKMKMYQDRVKVPVGGWAKSRLKKLSATDKRRDPARTGSGFGKNVSNWIGRDLVYPSNVLHMATECGNRRHGAAFPVRLPMWFIELFTERGDVVLDPFMGSGTTAIACVEMGRHFMGAEISAQYHRISESAISDARGSTLRRRSGPARTTVTATKRKPRVAEKTLEIYG